MKIYLWGIGILGKRDFSQTFSNIQFTGIIDSSVSFDSYMGVPVFRPEQIAKSNDYDLIFVSVWNSEAVLKSAVSLGYNLQKMVFLYRNYSFNDLNSETAYQNVKSLLNKAIYNDLRNRYRVIASPRVDFTSEEIFEIGSERKSGMYSDDYVRLRTFEFCQNEIKENNVPGNVAELGVFRGDFAKYINAAFSDRYLYLFDTFSGFDSDEASKEKEAGNIDDSFINDFSTTSIELVLSKMIKPDMCIIKKGFFPDSLDGLEDTFSFVSIDADLEDPIYNGLAYFYPRLNEGGYIFVHDYNHIHLHGVKKAIKRFESDNNIRLKKVPIPDTDGSLIITK